MADLDARPETADPVPAAAGTGRHRSAGPFPHRRARLRLVVVLSLLGLAALAIAAVHLGYGNPAPVGSAGFWRIAERRAGLLVVLVVVALCQAVATVSFQTVTGNRIITPSIMGFQSLYVLVQTGAVFGLGAAGVTALQGQSQFLLQVVLMVGFAALLYSWLLSGRFANLQIMLLVGIILGGGLGAVSTFLQRLLSPSDFDILSARLMGNLSNAEASYLPLAVPLTLGAAGVLYLRSRTLDVLALGREPSLNLGLHHRRQTIAVLLAVSVLMAVSTALVGPLTFLGFLVAMLSYQLADTYAHRIVLPVAWLTAFVVLGGAYVVLRHVFYAQGSVGIIIEIVGGTAFLIHVLRKGRL